MQIVSASLPRWLSFYSSGAICQATSWIQRLRHRIRRVPSAGPPSPRHLLTCPSEVHNQRPGWLGNSARTLSDSVTTTCGLPLSGGSRPRCASNPEVLAPADTNGHQRPPGNPCDRRLRSGCTPSDSVALRRTVRTVDHWDRIGLLPKAPFLSCPDVPLRRRRPYPTNSVDGLVEIVARNGTRREEQRSWA